MKENFNPGAGAEKNESAEQLPLLEKEEEFLKAVEEAVGQTMADHKFFAPYRILPVSGTGAKKEVKPIDSGVVLEVWGFLPAEEKKGREIDEYFQYLVLNIFRQKGYPINQGLENILKREKPLPRIISTPASGTSRVVRPEKKGRKGRSGGDIERIRRRHGLYGIPTGDIREDFED